MKGQKRGERTTIINLRVREATKSLFVEGAARDGVKLSAWLRALGLKRLSEQERGIDAKQEDVQGR